MRTCQTNRLLSRSGDGSVLAGDLPVSKLKLVQAWIEIHGECLLADLKWAVSGEPVFGKSAADELCVVPPLRYGTSRHWRRAAEGGVAGDIFLIRIGGGL